MAKALMIHVSRFTGTSAPFDPIPTELFETKGFVHDELVFLIQLCPYLCLYIEGKMRIFEFDFVHCRSSTHQ